MKVTKENLISVCKCLGLFLVLALAGRADCVPGYGPTMGWYWNSPGDWEIYSCTNSTYLSGSGGYAPGVNWVTQQYNTGQANYGDNWVSFEVDNGANDNGRLGVWGDIV